MGRRHAKEHLNWPKNFGETFMKKHCYMQKCRAFSEGAGKEGNTKPISLLVCKHFIASLLRDLPLSFRRPNSQFQQ